MLNEHNFRDIILCPPQQLFLQKRITGETLSLPELFHKEATALYLTALEKLIQVDNDSTSLDWTNARYRLMVPDWPLRTGECPEEASEFPIIYFRKQIYNGATPESLRYPSGIIETILKNQRGLVFFAGAQGSGKTTGACAFFEAWLRRYGGTGVTLEDPIEIPMPPYRREEDRGVLRESFIHQIEVYQGNHAGSFKKNFKLGVQRAFRMASPNVLLFGELRESQGAYSLLNMALTNCLVFTTIHGTNLIQSLERFSMFCRQEENEEIVNQTLSQAFVGAIFQKLTATAHGIQPQFEFLSNRAEVQNLLRAGMHEKLGDYIYKSS